MPIYNNLNVEKSNGLQFLQLKPDETSCASIYFYEDLDMVEFFDTEPFYNPIKFKQLIPFTAAVGETKQYMVTIPYEYIGKNDYVMVHTQCTSTVYNSVELFFNSMTNLPSLPLTNSNFILDNCHRVRRLHFQITGENSGTINVLIGDKYLVGQSMMVNTVRPS